MTSVEEVQEEIWSAIRDNRQFVHPRLAPLYAEIRRLNLDKYIDAVVIALVDSGQVRVIECHYSDCKFESRGFTPKAGRSRTTQLSIEHIDPRRNGGSNHLRNLTLFHASCNSSWRKGTSFSPEIIEKIAAAQRGKIISPEVRENLSRQQHILASTPYICSTCSSSFRGPVGIKAHWRQSTCPKEVL